MTFHELIVEVLNTFFNRSYKDTLWYKCCLNEVWEKYVIYKELKSKKKIIFRFLQLG